MPANKNKKPPTPPPAARPAEPPKAQAAYEQIKPEMAALSADSLGKINVDISQAVSISLGVLPGLAFLRPAMAKLPDFEIAHFDKLETYALGAWYAHLLALPPASATNPVQLLLEEASELRLVLLSERDRLDRGSWLLLGDRDRLGRGSWLLPSDRDRLDGGSWLLLDLVGRSTGGGRRGSLRLDVETGANSVAERC
jgi:hypothetical protein